MIRVHIKVLLCCCTIAQHPLYQVLGKFRIVILQNCNSIITNSICLLQNANLILQEIQSNFLCHLGSSQVHSNFIVSIAVCLHGAQIIGSMKTSHCNIDIGAFLCRNIEIHRQRIAQPKLLVRNLRLCCQCCFRRAFCRKCIYR